jgi:transcriptional regulator with XRE-family HTH domain
VGRLPPTPEDLARGARLRDLRKSLKLTQAQVFRDYEPAKDRESKRAQLTNAENGRNKLQGPFLLELAGALEIPVEVLHAYLGGKLPMAELRRQRSGTGGKAAVGTRPLAISASPNGDLAVRLSDKAIDSLAVVETLHELDGVDYGAAVKATKGIEQEAGDTFGLYVAARLKLRAEAGYALPGERILQVADVDDRPKKSGKPARR